MSRRASTATWVWGGGGGACREHPTRPPGLAWGKVVPGCHELCPFSVSAEEGPPPAGGQSPLHVLLFVLCLVLAALLLLTVLAFTATLLRLRKMSGNNHPHPTPAQNGGARQALATEVGGHCSPARATPFPGLSPGAAERGHRHPHPPPHPRFCPPSPRCVVPRISQRGAGQPQHPAPRRALRDLQRLQGDAPQPAQRTR